VKSAEDMDRDHLEVDQRTFIMLTTKRLNIPKVVVTMTAGAILMPWIDRVDAAATVFNPGKYAGAAFADVLWGVVNPSAKSPVMYPVNETGMTAVVPASKPDGQCPEQFDGDTPDPVEYTERLCVAWHCRDKAFVRFPFGHGMSYTTFAYKSASVFTSAADIATECPDQDPDKGLAKICITASVQNAGNRNGTEIAQLYMGYPEDLYEPPKVLRGFHRLEDIEPGAAQVARFPIYERDLQTYLVKDSGERCWAEIHPGTYKFYIGKSSEDPDELVEEVTWPPAGARVQM